jgi:peroxiredoxin
VRCACRFVAGGRTLIRRITLILASSRIVKVFYPVFPPDKHAAEVLGWLRNQSF